jgi:pSer/pThr/pTyr-binding forkhead associated (FHA) protein
VEEPEPLATDPSLETQANGPDIVVDFSLADGDIIDLSMIAAQPLFAGSELRPFLSFVQVGADTHLLVTPPLGQVSTETILLAVQADTITAASLTFTPPDGLPPFK